MPRENVRFKTLSPGCTVEVQPLSSEHAEGQLIMGVRRRSRPSAGLIVESENAFPIGALVLLDLKFPGQLYTYRSRGMVSWVVPGQDPERPNKLGVLVFGMDKLDEHGISVSIAAPPAAPMIDEMDSAHPEEILLDKYASVPPPAKPVVPTPIPFPPIPDPEPHAEPASLLSASVSGELVSLCAADVKIGKWLGTRVSSLPPPPATAPFQIPKKDIGSADDLFKNEILDAIDELSDPSLQEVAEEDEPPVPPSHEIANDDTVLAISLKDIGPLPEPAPSRLTETRRDTSPPVPDSVAPPVRRPSVPTFLQAFDSVPPDAGADVDDVMRFDAEGKMIEAFEHIHRMYMERDHDGAAAFALTLARDLISCDLGACLLISPQKYELYVAALEKPDSVTLNQANRPVNVGVIGNAIRSGVTIRVSDPRRDPNIDQTVDLSDDHDTRSLLAAPVHYEGHTMGALELRNSPRQIGFVEGEAHLLAYIATSLAEYIHTSLPARGKDS